LNEMLPRYYRQLFPFKSIVKWLSYNQKTSAYFALREFAFILENDVHLRYRSFSDALHFERELCKVCPHKLDIGAVYNYPPRDNKKHGDFAAKQRELVFDIDLTDYDSIRTCCREAIVCAKCWRWMAIAVLVLDRILEEDFGFVHRLWVFSGRRGVHCWVADETARRLSSTDRAGVADYLSLISTDQKRVEVVTTRNRMRVVHPMLEKAYRIIMASGQMDGLVIEQGWLDDERWPQLLKDLCLESDGDLRETLEHDFAQLATAELRWKALKLRFDEVERANAVGTIPTVSNERTQHFLQAFVLQYGYPRLDVNVSTGLNHLLKSPFCVHPKSGRIAVPINPKLVDKFNVDAVPRIDQLIGELAQSKENDESNDTRKRLDYKRTSLWPYVEHFESFIDGLTSTTAR